MLRRAVARHGRVHGLDHIVVHATSSPSSPKRVSSLLVHAAVIVLLSVLGGVLMSGCVALLLTPMVLDVGVGICPSTASIELAVRVCTLLHVIATLMIILWC